MKTIRPVVLSRTAQKILAECPRAGSGVHRWLFRAARLLNPHFTNKSCLTDVLARATRHCGRPVTSREIEDAIRNSQYNRRGIQRRKWPASNRQRIEAIANAGPSLDGLAAKSPHVFLSAAAHSEEVIDRLFPGNPLLCIGRDKQCFDTRTRDKWRGVLSEHQFIVPSPMSRICARTQSGRISKHTLNNTGPRRFLVVEFDLGTFDEHAALLSHLTDFLPLVLAVHSGSKSLHGWFLCAGIAESLLHRFMRYAVSLGADPMTWTRSQFVRLPDGQRNNGARQKVIYFNPAPLQSQ